MTLGAKQEIFTRLAFGQGGLIAFMIERGGHPRVFECARSDEQAAINALGFEGRQALAQMIEANARFHALALAILNNGRANGVLLSLHRLRLAVDIGLFNANGTYLLGAEPHQEFGEWWEAKSDGEIICCWGGRFGDPEHYSIEHEGRR